MTSHQTISPLMAAALCRTIRPTPRPSTDASTVKTSAHEAVATMLAVSPAARPPTAAPAVPVTMPMTPRTSPMRTAMTVLAATRTQRAGWAVRAVAQVPYWTSEVIDRMAVMAAMTAVRKVE
jgi:hypothetical protein